MALGDRTSDKDTTRTGQNPASDTPARSDRPAMADLEKALHETLARAMHTVDPILVIRQACLAMETSAQRRRIDLLRPYHLSVPPLQAERGPLLALLKAMIADALKATPNGGAVICSLRLLEDSLHFIVSDSSHDREDDDDPGGQGRLPNLEVLRGLARGLGAELSLTEFPLEGAVLDLSFRLENGLDTAPHLTPANRDPTGL